MAIFGIKAVRLNAAQTHVEAVLCCRVTFPAPGTFDLGPEQFAAKRRIVDLLSEGNQVWTLVAAPGGHWKRGQKVYIEPGAYGVANIESLPDGVEANNLRALPRF